MNLSELMPCFQGVIPSIISTCDAQGEPNCTYVSHVYWLDERHVALSCQFFNKTRRNIDENPRATVMVHHPVSLETYRLQLRYVRSETEGALFDTMSLRIDVIASHTGMTGVFRLISADVYAVESIEAVSGMLVASPVLSGGQADVPPGPMTELRAVQTISCRLAQASDLDGFVDETLLALDEHLGFAHSMLLVPCENGDRLVTLATRGYGRRGVGSEVVMGQGVIGCAAERRRVVRVTGMKMEIAYGRAIRHEIELTEGHAALHAEIALPGLPDAQAQLALPLVAGDRLVGVLAVESRDPMCFDDWDEALLQILGNQIALGIERRHDDDAEDDAATDGGAPSLDGVGSHRFVWYPHDESMFVDGEYLVRNVPAKILRKLLREHLDEGRTEFTNRELRMDPALGLPPLKDNLESRLILLRRRLEEKLPGVRLESTGRGRFALRIAGAIELTEKQVESA